MSDTLLLNIDHTPISLLPLSVIDWQHAIKLMWLDKIVVLENYDDWTVRSEKLAIDVPAVCITKEYFHYNKVIKLSRHNLYLRDLYQCQYCADTFDTADLTVDHVVPRASGGRTTWENVVTACRPCNSKKADKFGKPLRKPVRPEYYSLAKKLQTMHFKPRHPSWAKYLSFYQTKQVR
jgi:5-methylcytosine-specific restriction endonuclease McrA